MDKSNKSEVLKYMSNELSPDTEAGRKLIELNQENYRMLKTSLYGINHAISKIQLETSSIVDNFKTAFLPIHEMKEILDVQWITLANILQSSVAPELADIRKNLLKNDFYEAINSYNKVIAAQTITASNIAFIKKSSEFAEYLSLPRGLISVVQDLHVQAASQLQTEPNILLSLEKKVFFDKDAPSHEANIRETNVLCSGLLILEGITAQEMLEFLQYLAKYRDLGTEHHIGRKIFEAIQRWDQIAQIDKENYFRSRAREKDSCPYTQQEMQRAPYGVTYHGRYNHIGENHFYFSDKEAGAVLEAKNHCGENDIIQIAVLSPIEKFSVIDLSKDFPKSEFLKYCRFPLSKGDRSTVKREYLVPCFVASCCKKHRIDGIKYYGSREYSNFVTWSDHYFECVESYDYQKE